MLLLLLLYNRFCRAVYTFMVWQKRDLFVIKIKINSKKREKLDILLCLLGLLLLFIGLLYLPIGLLLLFISCLSNILERLISFFNGIWSVTIRDCRVNRVHRLRKNMRQNSLKTRLERSLRRKSISSMWLVDCIMAFWERCNRLQCRLHDFFTWRDDVP